ncbi:hypothetical protein GGS23DRAFT_595996 [Durotheca rogersii]|uniref:uncharacterized protein n=1 Tax=Durotheca rogersii TaxID=419775 RepID=UPI002220E348|nr:uncharacterized protein GGS23DRAFT_595996 [Durotheca rogersii]KAI5864364.1 hypothetical protein GGS23DRAFT_595996 [Durotheca rogersii]
MTDPSLKDSHALFSDSTGRGFDRNARLAQLRQFICNASLTTEERRYLKILLSGSGVDIIGELPIELVKQIAGLLDLPHFVTCLAVSRRWRDKFLSNSVLGDVVTKFCPSWERRASGDVRGGICAPLEALHRIGRARWECFQASLVKPFSWEHESYFKLDPTYHGNDEDVSAAYARFNQSPVEDLGSTACWNALYANGKIAWRAKTHTIVVDCLWSRTRKIFEVPRGPLHSPLVLLRALGNRLAVCVLDRRLIAWDHVSNVYLEKKLPSYTLDVTTEGHRVAVVLYTREIFLWEFGGKLTILPTTPLIAYHGLDTKTARSWESNLVVIFHPTCSRTLFLASGYTDYVDSKRVLKRVVYEFMDTKHIETFEIEIPPKLDNARSPKDVAVTIKKVLPYRRDTIGFCEQYPPVGEAVTPPYETFVEFDIYDRKFTARTDEEFDHVKFGWRATLEEADLDFLVRFYDNGFSVSSYHLGFDFRNDE